MEFDFILATLHRAQPLRYVSSILSLLHRSILDSTFASIEVDATRQKRAEGDLIDRLSKLLFEDLQHARPLPRVKQFNDFLRKKEIEEEELERGALPAPEPYTGVQLLDLRSAILALLYEVALSDHGGQLMAEHSPVIGRLVRFLHESIVKMYSTYNGSPLPSETKPGDPEAEDSIQIHATSLDEDVSSIHAQHVNTIVTILYHLNITYGSLESASQMSSSKPKADLRPILNIHASLESQPGAAQAYLVALSRVAFCEPWGFDVGIDSETSEMAHEMLDEFVIPEDGEGILGVFESGRTSGA